MKLSDDFLQEYISQLSGRLSSYVYNLFISSQQKPLFYDQYDEFSMWRYESFITKSLKP
jgi:hypothetical protein